VLTVITPATSFDLTTVEAVKAEIAIKNDALLATMITQASTAIADYCGMVLVQETVEETLRLDPGLQQIALRRRPVASVTNISEDGTALTADEYQIDKEAGLLLRLCNDRGIFWPSGKTVVRYVAGYAAGAIPAPLQRAAIELVKAWWAAKDVDPTVRDVEYSDGSSIAYQVNRPSLPPIVADLLAPYVSFRLA